MSVSLKNVTLVVLPIVLIALCVACLGFATSIPSVNPRTVDYFVNKQPVGRVIATTAIAVVEVDNYDSTSLISIGRQMFNKNNPNADSTINRTQVYFVKRGTSTEVPEMLKRQILANAPNGAELVKRVEYFKEAFMYIRGNINSQSFGIPAQDVLIKQETLLPRKPYKIKDLVK